MRTECRQGHPIKSSQDIRTNGHCAACARIAEARYRRAGQNARRQLKDVSTADITTELDNYWPESVKYTGARTHVSGRWLVISPKQKDFQSSLYQIDPDTDGLTWVMKALLPTIVHYVGLVESQQV